jgi:hypothetical protein
MDFAEEDEGMCFTMYECDEEISEASDEDLEEDLEEDEDLENIKKQLSDFSRNFIDDDEF